MKTPTPTVPAEGLSVQAVAAATGLDNASIYRAAEEAQLGSPAHFSYTRARIIYTLAGLHRIAEGLERLGEQIGAASLRELLRQARQETAHEQGQTSPSVPAVESWLTRFERRQEEEAAA